MTTSRVLVVFRTQQKSNGPSAVHCFFAPLGAFFIFGI